METKGLLFIPDISGFTNFVNKVDIAHGRLIIQELLEILVNANEIGLEISEIEGDAILFYKFGEAPDFEALYRQVQKMFCEFHQNLLAYDISKFCQCNACTSAIGLTLKVITHYGEFTDYKVKDFSKLIGKDVIVAHQLLKNDIDNHEYWLVTKNFHENSSSSSLPDEIQWHNNVKYTENGDIHYQYASLSALRDKVSPKSFPQLDFPNKIKVISSSKEYDTDIITLFRTSGMFDYRHRWQEGIKSVEEVHHYLPRVGMKCVCVSDAGQEVIYSSNYSFQPDRIEFSETNELKTKSTNYLLEKISDQKTRLTLDIYRKNNFLNKTIFNLTAKKKLTSQVQKSMENLEQFVQVVEFPY